MAVTPDVCELPQTRTVAEIEAPQLRTLLLTDICDSTELVERIGDVRAAELFQQHDRLVLGLQQQWHGRLIDRSDGLLLLFERPVDGLAFALDYLAGIGQLGKAMGLNLSARAGLHVGEVLTWRNSEQAVAGGAKQLEVEGLAKPMAARLMALARPSQILLSAVAESLTHRATRELGQRGERLLWKSHGRWRFKGVAVAQQVYEVGEIGVAPLRSPRPNAKTWRDVPLWRRPAALVAEISMLAAVAIGAWFMTKPAPAIAFSERDWVVVGDLNNLTGDVRLDGSLGQAFRISLQQSRYVNVLSDLKVRDTLRRMEKDPTKVPVTRSLGIEVAVRDGARALLIPSVAEIGDKLRVSLDVVDPTTGATALVLSHDGRGLQSVLASIDNVTARLRDELGETLDSVNNNSAPLPKVTTASLEALRSYALGKTAQDRGQLHEAITYYQQALELDANFALAHVELADCYVIMAETEKAQQQMDAANRLSARLPKREQLYLQAWTAELSGDSSLASDRWRTLVELYPDYYEAANNYIWRLEADGNYLLAQKYARLANVEQNAARASALVYLGISELALSQLDRARDTFREVEIIKGERPGARTAVITAASGDANAAIDELAEATEGQQLSHGQAIAKIDFLAQLGDFGRIEQITRERERYNIAFITRLFRFIDLSMKVAASDGGDSLGRSLLAQMRDARTAVEKGPVGDRPDNAYLAIASYYLMQRALPASANRDRLAEVEETARHVQDSAVAALLRLVQANQLLLEHRPHAAIAKLGENKKGVYLPDLFQADVVLRDAYAQLGDITHVMELDRKLSAQLPKAYGDYSGAYALQPLNVFDSSKAREAVAREADASKALAGI